MKELEYAKCVLDDEGLEVTILNQHAIRGMKKNKQYIIDLWAPHNKKTGKFLGYTALVWKDKKYYRKIQKDKLEELIIKSKI